eukprot:m.10977 g.10977  ORF g.10977 m.10977 type:complete len:233 (-) comp6788_c0_seq1:687-1385(-)
MTTSTSVSTDESVREIKVTKRSGVLQSAEQIAKKLHGSRKAVSQALENALHLEKILNEQDEIKKINSQQHTQGKQQDETTKSTDEMEEHQFAKDVIAENKELHTAMDMMRSVMSVVMAKRRQQVLALTHENEQLQAQAQTALDSERFKTKDLEKEIVVLKQKIEEMQSVMCAAVEADSGDNFHEIYEDISRVEDENRMLRELLSVSSDLTNECDSDGTTSSSTTTTGEREEE